MCGIAGIISVNKALVSTARLIKMTDAIAHRGPDGQQQWQNQSGTAGLAHRRLSIIDLSVNGEQPMHFHNRYSIVYNGEIYNYIELKQELVGKGYHFKSLSDTEVILAAYDCWKEKCLQYFDGMFALAIWDEQEQQLFAARDRFGEKPFYYCFNGNEFIFASEMKALWAAGIERKVNKQLLYNFITLGYTQNPANPSETAYGHIYKLPAASFFSYSLQKNKLVEPALYWQLDKNAIDSSISESAAIEKFTALFKQSVQKRLRSDVPLGTSLSGGLDSSSIATIIQQIQGAATGLQTFSSIFPGTAADESAYIQLLTTDKALTNFQVQPTAEGFINDFEKLCYQQETFMGSASVYAQYKVFELAEQQGIKVLLDGQGADEILAGYHKYYHWYWQELYKTDRQLLQQEITTARQLGVTDQWGWKNKLAAAWPAYATGLIKSSRASKQRGAGGIDGGFASDFGKSYYALPPQDSLQNVLYYNTFNNGLEELLHYADRNSMAHGREVRLPFLQHQLVEFIFSLPAQFKIKDGRNKWLLRKAMENKMPPAIVWRKDKIGFEPPQQYWMQHPVVQEYILNARQKLVAAGVLKKKVLSAKLKPLGANAADNFDWRHLVAARFFE